jgi:hypothetical protein
MHAHQGDLSIAVDEDTVGHGVVDGDHPDQRLTPCCWLGHRLLGVHNNWWSGVLLLSCGRVGVCWGLGLVPSVVAGINVKL